MQRNYLKVGDKSSAGGTVIEGIPTCTHHGGELTYLGAQVICPSCKSTGRIVPKGPRWPHEMMGKEAALEGDVCACRCYPPPTMIASQSSMFQSFESHHLADQGFASNGLPFTPEPLSNFDERVRVLDGNGRPIAGVPYHIKTDAGGVHKGVTDEQGYCPRVYTSDAQNLDIAIGYQAVQRWNT
ncbi:TPA: PAAR domain-containing protein [Burkholderia cepacia]|uniref:PAAR domain-containing protein n=1 Tax=Burkholderia cepacia TaxID=292 RepID=UPI001CF55EEC|nr:PAAR domain-containing protein [Burkholderia cepacia]HDR9769768.1 PAAR domain-containing protein [Burkholderia cepacia ATCC 25416]MCA8361220.1 PAAR domain-containing protein [Burkholderia cepacia]HDR9779756.1 PAAR domain-containing protein [Burkholderia cepacia ATCC 25416]HDR9785822.1 PAAR domain-containing protein [Burkholderia cepacia ATCC 25416]HDR9795915.1 PAAR domain-containing protein [Burkholderia cepacia ATCC 25416]